MASSPFTYTSEAGVSVSAPAFDIAVGAGFLRKHRKDSELDLMFAIVEEALDAKNLKEFDKLSLEEMNDFLGKWQEAAGVSAGN